MPCTHTTPSRAASRPAPLRALTIQSTDKRLQVPTGGGAGAAPAPNAGAGPSGPSVPPLPPASSGVDELADESDDSDLVHSADESVSSEHSWAERAAAPAAAGGRGRGRGRGGGRGRAPAPAAAGKGRGRGRGRGRGGAAAAAPAAAESDGDDEDDDEEAAPTKQSKYPRKNLSDHNFTLRVQYQGSELPTLHARFDGLSRVGLEPAVRLRVVQRAGMTGTLCACECAVYVRESGCARC